ncbi:hypothetical protein BXY66_3430 [Shimia isoporae]|uniref:Rap1a immunity protein domain-containing protein n=1 Tax=Shimia isoporae TaxID=647720 RepID=A0A4R1N4T5_9RHOB|nr:Rap1a/Tai family immunity protein [Shimia isoporae]TCL00783.1 hypothetical protein BXY66_3430 [Shimia isoporae]
MRLILALAAAGALASPAAADPKYTAKDLLSPCTEADNDARWGEAAETECEQYIMGFIAGLEATGNAGPGTKICPPDQNTADEARWAFMRWVHGDFTKRKAMPASDGLMAALEERFPCGS